MKVNFTKSVTKLIKDITNCYIEISKELDLSQEEALCYAIFKKTRETDSFLNELYNLENLKGITLPSEDEKYSLKKDKKESYVYVKDHILNTLMNFKKEYIKQLKYPIKTIDIACAYMIYYKNETKNYFQINEDKYLLLKNIMLLKTVPNYNTNENISNSEKKQELKKINETNEENNEMLTKFGINNLTEQYYISSPLVGNEIALKKLTKKLLLGDSVIIIGKSGVGKTTLVKGLAYNIKNNLAHPNLANKNIIELPIGNLIANTKYVGSLENHISEILNYAKKNKNTIFFLDEIHMLIGAGLTEKSNIDVANLLKVPLSNNQIQIIGATTISEYDKTIATDEALRGRFEILSLQEPTHDEIFAIANNYIKLMQQQTNIKWNFNDKFLRALIKLTDTSNIVFFETINNPRLILKLLKGIFESALYYNKNLIDIEDIKESIEDNEILSNYSKELIIKNLSSNTVNSTSKQDVIGKKLILFHQNSHK